jgi:transcriptional regulator with XRE-family HTH domain
MIVPVPDKDPRRQLGELIQRARVARESSHRDVAQHCGVPQSQVKEWEDGEDVPRGNVWARLKGMLFSLRPATSVWQAALRAAEGTTTAEVEARIEQQASAAAPNAANDAAELPEPPPLEDPRTQTSFGAALRIARLNIGFTQDELGQYVGVAGPTISAWENEASMPVLDNYNKLVDALPELRSCTPPGVRNIQKPVGRPPGLNLFPRAPTNPGGPQFPRAPTQQPIAPEPEAAGQQGSTDAIAQAGIVYAYALKEEQRAKERLALLQRQISTAGEAVKTAATKATEALKQLMQTVGVS